MKIHEFQAKQLFARYGVPIPEGEVAGSGPDAASIAARLGYPCVIKAQVHAGGRGKAGGSGWPATAKKRSGSPSGFWA